MKPTANWRAPIKPDLSPERRPLARVALLGLWTPKSQNLPRGRDPVQLDPKVTITQWCDDVLSSRVETGRHPQECKLQLDLDGSGYSFQLCSCEADSLSESAEPCRHLKATIVQALRILYNLDLDPSRAPTLPWSQVCAWSPLQVGPAAEQLRLVLIPEPHPQWQLWRGVGSPTCWSRITSRSAAVLRAAGVWNSRLEQRLETLLTEGHDLAQSLECAALLINTVPNTQLALGEVAHPVQLDVGSRWQFVLIRRGDGSYGARFVPERCDLGNALGGWSHHDAGLHAVAPAAGKQLFVSFTPPPIDTLIDQLATRQLDPQRDALEFVDTFTQLQQAFTLELDLPIPRTCENAPLHYVLRLFPESDRVRAQLQVRDRDGPGLSWPLGEGPARYVLLRARDFRQRIRDRSAELAVGQQFAELVAHTGGRLSTPCHAYWDRLENLLELLHALRPAALHEHLIHLEWPLSDVPPPARLLDLAHNDPDLHELESRQGTGGDWLDLHGCVLVQGYRIPVGELLAALIQKKPFVQVSERLWLRLCERVRACLTPVLESLGAATWSRLERADPGPLTLASTCTLGTDLDPIAQDPLPEPSNPPQVRATLRPYQREGVDWLCTRAARGLGCILADDMGLGKTLQTIAALSTRPRDETHLVLCPASCVAGWNSEFSRFAPQMPVYPVASNDPLPRGSTLIIGYELFVSRQQEFRSRAFAGLILDEAQRLKSHDTLLHNALRHLRCTFKIALSGTPVENKVEEIWSIFHLLQPDLLGSLSEFRSLLRYHATDLEPHAFLTRKIQPLILRRTKETHLPQMPPLSYTGLCVRLTPAERHEYESLRLAALVALGARPADSGPGTSILPHIHALRSWCSQPHPQSHCPHPKIRAFLDLYWRTLHPQQRRILVFSQFPALLEAIDLALRTDDQPVLRFDGSTPAAERQRQIAAFEAGHSDLFLISLKAGGVGLNLTRANTVVHLDPWWNPALEDQATCRAHRMGQAESVQVYRFYCENSIEQKILALHAQKRELADTLMSPHQARALLGAGPETSPEPSL